MTKKLHFFTFIVFFLALLLGLKIASQKLLWTDEMYTQALNIEPFSLKDILLGKTTEGNLCPLFYVIQKIYLNICHYRLPFEWQRETFFYELKSQIILRLPAIIYMSAALALIFYTFARYYSYSIAVLAIILALSNPMVWLYWAESRPYSLWFFLTVVQIFLFLKVLHQKTPTPQAWLWLGLCHIFLALTIIFSLPQILMVSLAFYLLQKTDGKKLLSIVCVCFFLSWFYYIQTKKTYGWIPTDINHPALAISQIFSTKAIKLVKIWATYLLSLNIPWVWYLPLTSYVFFLIIKNICSRFKSSVHQWYTLKEAIYFLIFTLILLISSFIILSIFAIWVSSGITNYAVSERYFIFIVPYALTALMLIYVNFLRLTKDLLWRLIMFIIYAGTVLCSGLVALIYISSWGMF